MKSSPIICSSGADRKVSDRIACYALYIDPPLGRVGMTEAEARATGKRIVVGQRPMTRIARAREKDETSGLMKIVVDAETQAILGAAILGTGGDEAVHAVLDMMAAGGNARTLAHTMHIHPTVAELLPTIAGELRAEAEGARQRLKLVLADREADHGISAGLSVTCAPLIVGSKDPAPALCLRS